MINTGVTKKNPFPGSRPFVSAEDKFFFGRRPVIKELVETLQANRFVALVGASASGKTSLIQSGIIPALLADSKKEWIPVSIRPGARPMASLIRGFQQVFPQKISDQEVAAFLSNAQNIGEFITEKKLGNYQYYLVVDQFEELFTGPASIKKKKKNGGIRKQGSLSKTWWMLWRTGLRAYMSCYPSAPTFWMFVLLTGY